MVLTDICMWVISGSINISILGYENGSRGFLRNVAMHIPEYTTSLHNEHGYEQKENSNRHRSPSLNLQAPNLTNHVTSLPCSLTSSSSSSSSSSSIYCIQAIQLQVTAIGYRICPILDYAPTMGQVDLAILTIHLI
jgi:hypothetical protein